MLNYIGLKLVGSIDSANASLIPMLNYIGLKPPLLPVQLSSFDAYVKLHKY